jgi:hypothetical protein
MTPEEIKATRERIIDILINYRLTDILDFTGRVEATRVCLSALAAEHLMIAEDQDIPGTAYAREIGFRKVYPLEESKE